MKMQIILNTRSISRPHLEEGVPASGAEGLSRRVDVHARDSVFVSGDLEGCVSTYFDRVPRVAIVIIISSKEQSSRLGEAHRSDTAHGLWLAASCEL